MSSMTLSMGTCEAEIHDVLASCPGGRLIAGNLGEALAELRLDFLPDEAEVRKMSSLLVDEDRRAGTCILAVR